MRLIYIGVQRGGCRAQVGRGPRRLPALAYSGGSLEAETGWGTQCGVGSRLKINLLRQKTNLRFLCISIIYMSLLGAVVFKLNNATGKFRG